MIMWVQPSTGKARQLETDISIALTTASRAEMATIRKQSCGPLRRSPPFLTPSSPTRWQAQCDAVGVIHSAKMRANPQSAVGLMRMGGDGPQVLSTFTSDYGTLLSELHKTRIHGTAHLTASIQVAYVRITIIRVTPDWHG